MCAYSPRIEQHRLGAGEMRFVQPVDQCAFVVRLAAIDAQTQCRGTLGEPLVDVLQRVMPIDFGLARAQQVEIWARKDKDGGRFGTLVGQGHGLSVATRVAPPIWAARQKAKQAGLVISIILNGDTRQVRAGSIADLVASLGLDVKKVAVERNREIVPRSTLADVALAEGDALEIVHFVGGGC